MTPVSSPMKKKEKYIFWVYLSWVRVMTDPMGKVFIKLFFIRMNKNFIKTVLGGGVPMS